MEKDKHYFAVGLFIIGLFIAGAFFSVWLGGSGHRDDILYRIRFADSVSGLAIGDPVKYRGVDVGSVEAMEIDPDDVRFVRVDVKLRKDTPVRTDTKASLRLKGITGVVFVELAGESPDAPSLLSQTPAGQVPVIPAEKNSLNAVLDQLPKTLKKVEDVADQAKKLMSDKNIAALSDMIGQLREAAHKANDLTTSLKEDPSQLLKGPKKTKESVDQEPNRTIPRRAVY